MYQYQSEYYPYSAFTDLTSTHLQGPTKFYNIFYSMTMEINMATNR